MTIAEVIDTLQTWINEADDEFDREEQGRVEGLRQALYEIEKIEEPKVGRWLEKEVISDKVIEEWQSARCSVCDRYHTTPYMYYFSHYDYCPHCGAKMERRQKVDKGRSKRNR